MEAIGKLPERDWLHDLETVRVMKALLAGGKPARFVGGCVRDAILGKDITDIDIATPETPEKVLELLAAAGIRTEPIGIDHGSVLAIQPHMTYHITTLRADIETFGRKALVNYIDDWTEDAARRDFTMNALYADLDGTLYDPCQGLEDVKAGRVHFIGNPADRIQEDYLRILRFFRFRAYYGLVPSAEEDLKACQRFAPKIRSLSSERVWYELRRLLRSTDPCQALEDMFDYDILSSIFSYQVHDKAIHKDLPLLIRLEATYQAPPCPIRRLTCILGESIHAAQHIRSDLPLSGKDLSHLILLTKLLKERPDLSIPYEAHKILYLQGTDIYLDYVLLNAANDASSHIEQHLSFLHSWNSPVLPVRGKDIMEQGRINGPQVGILMQELTEWWLKEGCKPSRDQCLQWLRDRNNL